MEENKIVLFESLDGSVKLNVPIKDENVWLNRNQIAKLFDRDIKTIGKHINNALKEELDDSTIAKFATVQTEGGRKVERMIEHYNLDAILSVGYRVKSKRGIDFRKWANSVLKSYIIKGAALNHNRLIELNETVRVIQRIENDPDTKQVLSVVERYSHALDLLDAYDHQNMTRPQGNKAVYVLTYQECRDVIESMKFGHSSTLFGNEKDDSFKSSIGAIYQSYNNEDVYPSLEEKAANLLYFITKNHSFSDGNKRIAAALFLYFLHKNNVLFVDGEKLINDYTLVALTLMIAESNPAEKEMMISVIMNCMVQP